MAVVKVYNQAGKEVGQHTLSDAVFNVAIKPEVIQQVVVGQQANARQVIASTKDRSEVRGGGKKPWRQKGTGRARHGSIRSPLWRGGGVTFGPTTDRNFSVKINKKVSKKALAMALSDKVAQERLIALDALSLIEKKTKHVFTVLQNFKLRPTKKLKTEKVATEKKKPVVKSQNVLIVTDAKDENVKLAARNVPKLETVTSGSMSLLSVLKADYVIASVDALKTIEKNFTK